MANGKSNANTVEFITLAVAQTWLFSSTVSGFIIKMLPWMHFMGKYK